MDEASRIIQTAPAVKRKSFGPVILTPPQVAAAQSRLPDRGRQAETLTVLPAIFDAKVLQELIKVLGETATRSGAGTSCLDRIIQQRKTFCRKGEKPLDSI